jgi:hypothetical protein
MYSGLQLPAGSASRFQNCVDRFRHLVWWSVSIPIVAFEVRGAICLWNTLFPPTTNSRQRVEDCRIRGNADYQLLSKR